MSDGDHAPPPSKEATTRILVWLVFGLFFVWGGATSLNDILIPKLKALFSLTYVEAMLSQFAFFMAYFLVSIPAGTLVSKIGYVRGLVVGLGLMAVGALLFWPAASSGGYWPFLIALFVLACGITILQVASNPLIDTLGAPATASSRLTFAQAFNSLGTTVWPYIGARLILDSTAAPKVRTLETVCHIYAVIAAALAVVALVFWSRRHVLPTEQPDAVGLFESLALLRQRRMLFGTIALFVYVGAEVSIGSILVNVLEQPAFYTGLIAVRPHDDVGVGVARTHADSRSMRSSAEHATELFYGVHFFPWLVLRPNVQLVVDPGGDTNAQDVVVLGVKGAVTL